MRNHTLGIILISILPLIIQCYQNSDDDLFILLDSSKIFKCRGVQNYQLKIEKDDIGISDIKGNKVHYVRAPGNYTIHFKKIDVLSQLGHLIGELSATLQVPLFEGPAGIRFDFPFQAIPESTNLVTRKCDDESGVIERGSTPYCRYCNLCRTTKSIRGELHRKSILNSHEFRDTQKEIADVCGKIDEKTYEIRRTVRIPGRKELEEEANRTKIDPELKTKLEKGQGRLVVFLNLLNTHEETVSLDEFYTSKAECRCCSEKNAKDMACKLLKFLYCHEEECKSKHASQCIPAKTKVAACYTVQFFYRVTTDFQEVREFLRAKGLPDEEEPPPISDNSEQDLETPPPAFWKLPSSSTTTSTTTTVTQKTSTTTSRPVTRKQFMTVATTKKTTKSNSGISDSVKKKCIEKISFGVIKRLCRLLWRDQYCCSHCDGVC